MLVASTRIRNGVEGIYHYWARVDDLAPTGPARQDGVKQLAGDDAESNVPIGNRNEQDERFVPSPETYDTSVETLYALAKDGDPWWIEEDDVGRLYTSGGCAIYAAALVDVNPGWTVIADGEEGCLEYDEDEPDLRPCGDYGNDVCGCMVHHFYALSPDGWAYDVNGEHDPVALSEAKTLRSIGDESLTNVLNSWYDDDVSADVASLALTLVSRGDT